MATYSVSEIQQYLRCRRAWDLTSQNRKGLVKIGITPAPLQLGSALHQAFDAQAGGQDPLARVETYFREEEERITTEYRTLVGTAPSPEEMESFHKVADDAYALAHRYFSHYGWDHPLGDDYEYIETEVTFKIPIPGTRNFLAGTIDGLVRHKPTDALWIAEHKTFSQQPNFDKMTTDWQLSCYTWAADILFGRVAGVLYDGIAKRFPKPPALLKSGGLSKSITTLASTDEQTYRDAIREHGLDPDDYRDVLAALILRDSQPQTPFFTRWRVEMPRHQLLETERQLTALTREMSSPDTAIVPNFRWEGCWDCGVRDLCKAIQFGEDVEWLIKNAYRRGDGHATVKRLSRPVREVTSIADLERAKVNA